MIAPTLETLRGWGEVNVSRSWVYRPARADDVPACLADAARRGLTVTHRGAGRSYGDAALNQGGAVVEMSGLDRVTRFDPDRGLVTAEAGVTMGQLWRDTLPRGWWPPVVAGTMHTTLGGSAAMNIHGKNHAQAGPIGDHVTGLTFLEPTGSVISLTRDADPRRLDGILGAQGLNGTILDVTLRLRRVHSGYLEVRPVRAGGLDAALEALDAGIADSDYAVGWIDCFPSRRPGPGILHFARHLPPDHPLAGRGLDVESQSLPKAILGVFPVHQAWRALRAMASNPGMRLLNVGKRMAGALGRGTPYIQPHAAFHFLLDYIPRWKRLYDPHGLVQYQFFVPAAAAPHTLAEALRRQRRAEIFSYLAVLKRHRADHSAAGYAVDGFSLALDFPVRPSRSGKLARLLRDFDAMQRECGGRIYAAKDAVSLGTLPADRHPRFSSNLARRWARA